MAHDLDITQLRDELIDAFEWGEEERATSLASQLAERPRQVRSVLEEMLASPDASVRRAAVFGLGVLGGAASVKRLERQMTIEEARDDYDGASVLEVIAQALGRIKETDARASLIRRLTRLVDNNPKQTDVNDVVYALWRKRHPELIPVIRNALEKLPEKDSWALHALLHLLETRPEELARWALDQDVAPGLKANVMAILDEEVPDEFLSVFPAFIAAANTLASVAVDPKDEAWEYCDRLFTTLLLHKERILPALPTEARAELRTLTRRCVAAHIPNCSLGAAVVLQHVGIPEDALLLEAHRPEDSTFAKVFDDAARVLRNLPAS